MQGAVRSRRLAAFASTATPQMGAAVPALRGIASVPVSASRLFDVFSIRLQSRALIPERWQSLRREELASVSFVYGAPGRITRHIRVPRPFGVRLSAVQNRYPAILSNLD